MAGRVNCEACIEEAKLERYIFVASITVFRRACRKEIERRNEMINTTSANIGLKLHYVSAEKKNNRRVCNSGIYTFLCYHRFYIKDKRKRKKRERERERQRERERETERGRERGRERERERESYLSSIS